MSGKEWDKSEEGLEYPLCATGGVNYSWTEVWMEIPVDKARVHGEGSSHIQPPGTTNLSTGSMETLASTQVSGGTITKKSTRNNN